MTEAPARQPRGARLVAPLAVFAVGTAACLVLIWTAPRTESEEQVIAPKIVQVVEVVPSAQRISVTAYGSVIPARSVTIRPEVRGRVIRHHPAMVPGGFIRATEELLGIDPSDYELALTEQEAALEEAEFERAVERGRQVVASREWRLLEQDLPASEADRSLVLREPHLRLTEARMEKARNEIAKAKLNLARTSIAAPFNVMVLDESIEEGQLIEPGREVATLVGTDEFWVRAVVPIEKLRWIDLPDGERQGARARVVLETGDDNPIVREGRAVRLLSDLQRSGRMARVLIEVPDPLSLAASSRELPLLLGSFVRVDIDAGQLENVLVIDRAALRGGDRIWIVDSLNRLQIRAASVLWARDDAVLIPNVVQPGERLIVSGLRLAVPGMTVSPLPAPDAGSAAAGTPIESP